MPTALGLALALLSELLLPPKTISASSPEAGKLSVVCGPVPSAAQYGFYHDNQDGTFTELGVADTNEPPVVSMETGTYRVRAAGIAADGRVGLLSPALEVTVE